MPPLDSGSILTVSRTVSRPGKASPASMGSGRPHSQHRGGVSRTARRSSETKFCAEQAPQSTIIRGDCTPGRPRLTKKKGGYYDGAMQIEKGIDKLRNTVRALISP